MCGKQAVVFCTFSESSMIFHATTTATDCATEIGAQTAQVSNCTYTLQA